MFLSSLPRFFHFLILKYYMKKLFLIFICTIFSINIYSANYLTLSAFYDVTNMLNTLKDDGLFKRDDNLLKKELLKASVSSLSDPRAAYFDKDELDNFSDNSTDYAGLGMINSKDPYSGLLRVDRVFESSPAFFASLKVSDIILAVDNIDITSLSLSASSKLLRGEEGTSVKLKVLRDSEILEFNISREAIHTQNIFSTILDNNVGYIIIYELRDSSFNDFLKSFLSLKDKGIKDFILDLRYNNSFNSHQGNKIATLFVNKGDIIVHQQYKKELKTLVAQSDKIVSDDDFFLILTNDNTGASSNLIIAGINEKQKLIYGKDTLANTYNETFISYNDGLIRFSDSFFIDKNGKNLILEGYKADYLDKSFDLSRREAYQINKISKNFESFIKENPEASEENIKKFISTYKNDEISEDILRSYIKKAYLAKDPFNKILQLDEPVKKAWDILIQRRGK